MADKSYVRRARLNLTDDIEEARLMVGLSLDDAVELCAVSFRTWYRWKSEKAPKWAVRLVLSQTGKLDHLGWKNWEIRKGRLYCNDFNYRYYWEPQHLVLPMYGVKPNQFEEQDSDRMSPVVPFHIPKIVRK